MDRLWRLPTAVELELMYETLHRNGIGRFVSNYYWSSSALDNGIAYGLYFMYGKPELLVKSFTYRVRLVRTFYSSGEYNIGDAGIGGGLVFHAEPSTNGMFKYYESSTSDLNIKGRYHLTWDEATAFVGGLYE